MREGKKRRLPLKIEKSVDCKKENNFIFNQFHLKALLEAHAIASANNDPNMCEFLESHFLQEQVDGIKQLADYITQIETSECELSNYLFDKYLLHEDQSMHKK